MIKINNITLNSNDFVLTEVGEILVAKKRISEDAKIFGANGSYILHDGAYESQERILKFTVSSFDKVGELTRIFTDFDNEIEFDYIKLSKYYADLVDISYGKKGNKRWTVSVKLRFAPFRYLSDNGLNTIGTSGTINNPGDVFSEPIIEIEGNGEVSLTIGLQTMILNLDTKAIIDCRHKKQNVYDKNRVLKNSIRIRGGFFEILPGLQGIATNGNVSRVKIKGNWRWIV